MVDLSLFCIDLYWSKAESVVYDAMRGGRSPGLDGPPESVMERLAVLVLAHSYTVLVRKITFQCNSL